MSWGSSDPKDGHNLTAVAIKPDRRRRGCAWCPGKVLVTHSGRANGVALMSGCEWHVRKWARGQLGRVVKR